MPAGLWSAEPVAAPRPMMGPYRTRIAKSDEGRPIVKDLAFTTNLTGGRSVLLRSGTPYTLRASVARSPPRRLLYRRPDTRCLRTQSGARPATRSRSRRLQHPFLAVPAISLPQHRQRPIPHSATNAAFQRLARRVRNRCSRSNCLTAAFANTPARSGRSTWPRRSARVWPRPR